MTALLNAITIIKFALGILPELFAAVRSIEEQLPISGQGKEKLNLILGVVEEAAGSITEAAPLIEKLVGLVVGFLNRTGVFSK